MHAMLRCIEQLRRSIRGIAFWLQNKYNDNIVTNQILINTNNINNNNNSRIIW